MRIPFSSLRYTRGDPQTWGIMLYRNYPRDRHYQFFSTRLPRGSNCFVCHSNVLAGLKDLPPGGHLVAAPYVAASEVGEPRGEPGTPLVNGPAKPRAGFDLKWTPSADDALDATVNPDFSQIESDTAQIATNQRFALFFPEKRPFFLEGVELLNTPIQAVYTRTITDPDFGARMTGKHGSTGYTVLVAEDAGGGSVILPGPNGSDLAPQDFHSLVTVARVRHEIGRSFVGVLADRSRGRRQRLQPRRRPRLPASSHVDGRHHRAVALQRHAEPEPARRLERMDRAVAELERGERALDAQHHALRRVHVLQRRRPGLPRQHGLRPAGGLSRRLFRDGIHNLSEGLLLAPADLRHHRLPGRSGGRADLPAGLARRRHGRPLELVHAFPLRERPRAERRPDVPAAAVRLRGAGEPVAAVSRSSAPTATWARKWTSRTRGRAKARR